MQSGRRTSREAWGDWDARGLGERIRQLRRELGLSQTRFARLLGPPFDQSVLSRFESGQAVPPLPALMRLATVGGPGWTLERLAMGKFDVPADDPRIAEAVAEMHAAMRDSRSSLNGDRREIDFHAVGGALRTAALQFPVLRTYPPNFKPRELPAPFPETVWLSREIQPILPMKYRIHSCKIARSPHHLAYYIKPLVGKEIILYWDQWTDTLLGDDQFAS